MRLYRSFSHMPLLCGFFLLFHVYCVIPAFLSKKTYQGTFNEQTHQHNKLPTRGNNAVSSFFLTHLHKASLDAHYDLHLPCHALLYRLRLPSLLALLLYGLALSCCQDFLPRCFYFPSPPLLTSSLYRRTAAELIEMLSVSLDSFGLPNHAVRSVVDFFGMPRRALPSHVAAAKHKGTSDFDAPTRDSPDGSQPAQLFYTERSDSTTSLLNGTEESLLVLHSYEVVGRSLRGPRDGAMGL